jgi:hypothetical protein
MGEFYPLPASGGISPTDKLRKDSALTPVTSEKSTLFSWVTKIVRLCKDLYRYRLEEIVITIDSIECLSHSLKNNKISTFEHY